MGFDRVATENLIDNAVTESKLSDGAVTDTKLAGSITEAKRAGATSVTISASNQTIQHNNTE